MVKGRLLGEAAKEWDMKGGSVKGDTALVFPLLTGGLVFGILAICSA